MVKSEEEKVTVAKKKLPTIIMTGASGFIGGNLLEMLREDYRIFAMARRSRKEAGIPFHKNIHSAPIPCWMYSEIGSCGYGS